MTKGLRYLINSALLLLKGYKVTKLTISDAYCCVDKSRFKLRLCYPEFTVFTKNKNYAILGVDGNIIHFDSNEQVINHYQVIYNDLAMFLCNGAKSIHNSSIFTHNLWLTELRDNFCYILECDYLDPDFDYELPCSEIGLKIANAL